MYDKYVCIVQRNQSLLTLYQLKSVYANPLQAEASLC